MCDTLVSRFPAKRSGDTLSSAAQPAMSTMCGATVGRFPSTRSGRIHGSEAQCSDTSIMRSGDAPSSAAQPAVSNMCNEWQWLSMCVDLRTSARKANVRKL